MIKVTVKALYTEHHDTILEAYFTDFEACQDDLRMFIKPSVFGNSNFEVKVEEV